ncbi:hypothetical protein [Colwellia sp. 20A7]|uniref:hypothetical protein n=1 Tax=Colwellia sp. 20A7 TaxID=2689569 RepID=UPI0013575C20|nr:hypothetical protein [Colwellia sp. 20A7]
METQADINWKSYASTFLNDKNIKLRVGSKFKTAFPWINGVVTPAMPTRMLSNVVVFESWQNPHNMRIAKEIVKSNKKITLRELVSEMLITSEIPYIWWLYPVSTKVRAIHEDANGITFIKLNNKWQMVFSSKMVGALVGAQGGLNTESFPPNSYFISWENEELARNHAK